MWQIGVIVASAAFTVLAGFFVFVLLESRRTMRHAQETLSRIERELEKTAEESLRTIRVSREVLEDVKGRLKATDGFVAAMEQTGDAARKLSHSVKLVSRTIADTALEARETLHSRQDTVKDVIELATIGIQLWQRWQAQKLSPPVQRTNDPATKGDEHDGSK